MLKNRFLQVFICVLFFAVSNSFAQSKKLNYEEDSLAFYGKLMLKGHTDEIRLHANMQFHTLLKKSLSLPNSFDYPYDSLTMIARLIPEDKSFRIFNWQLPLNDGSYRFYAFFQSFNESTKKYVVYELTDGTEKIRIPQEEKLPYNKWYSAHYYRIITKKSDGKKYYTILGWKGSNGTSQRKVIDAFTVSSAGEPYFGSSIFKAGRKAAKRLVFEYSCEVSMSVKYDESKDIIVYDHLSPKEPELKGQYQYYGPDFSYDALAFKKGRWVKIEDYDARNYEQKYTKTDAKNDIELVNEKLQKGIISKDQYLKEIENIQRKLNPNKVDPSKELFRKKEEKAN